jgi:hypothetical protein
MDLSQTELVRAVELALGIERDLRPGTPGPVAHIIARSREETILALAGLITVDPRAEAEIRDLQNVIARHRDIMRFLGEAVAEGKDASAKLSDEDLEDIEATLGLSESTD